jgi:conjugal transfer pilus assembly protein TraW
MAGEPSFPPTARLVALGQAIIVGILILAALALGFAASAQALLESRSTIGRTWPIAEPDALSEIEAKAATLPRDMSKAFGARKNWSALKAAGLAVAPSDRVRSVVPFYTLEFDIRLPEGKTLYPKGYTFNPLTYVRLPQRLVVVHSRDLAWAMRVARPSDFILLAALDGENGDPITLGEKTGRSVYILEERVKERLGLQAAPVIVAQAGQRLVLTEYGPRVRTAPGAAK